MASTKRAAKSAATRRVHSVSARLSVVELTKAGTALTLEIRGNEGKLGELEIGRGALYWTGKSRQKSKRIGWTRFAEMMDELSGENFRSSRAST